MNSFLKKALFLVICTSTLFSFKNCPNQDNFYQKIFSYSSECISKEEGDRVYLKPHKVLKFNNKNYLQLDKNELLPIPYLHSDSTGNFISYKDAYDGMNYCLICGKIKFEGEACLNPECPLYSEN